MDIGSLKDLVEKDIKITEFEVIENDYNLSCKHLSPGEEATARAILINFIEDGKPCQLLIKAFCSANVPFLLYSLKKGECVV